MLTFEDFVVCESSQSAFSAAIAVADHPGSVYNPLFLHGPVGSGKSHLLRAIETRMRDRRPAATIVRMATRNFVDSLLDAIRADDVNAFRATLDAVDAVLLDDFYVLRDSPVAQQEIIRTLSALPQRGVQVVVTSDALVREWNAFYVAIDFPDETARREIARRAVANAALKLSRPALRSLARRTSGSPRLLQNAIARIAAEALLTA